MMREEQVEELARPLRGRDLVVFSNDWDGDPLSKTHIMRILSKENRILWVNSIGNRAPKASAHDFKRLWKKLGAFTQGLKEVEPNLFVLAPLAIPLYGSPAIHAANRVLLRAQIRRAMRRLRFNRPISWSFLPASAPVSGTLGEKLVVYHCVDEFSAFGDTNGRQIADLETVLLRKADIVITSAERLRANKAQTNPRTVLVTHGVDYHHFVKACDPNLQVPVDLASLPKPVIGFFGLVADWVDLDVFEACARAHPEGSVVILGKIAPGVDVTKLKALPNVHFLGRKAYGELPAYCRGFDVSLMPFRWNELTLNSNPLKVREYLAAGLPCVSTALPEVERVGLCKLARTPQEFVARVNECLADGGGPSLARAQRVISESWDARVDEIQQHIGRAMLARSATENALLETPA